MTAYQQFSPNIRNQAKLMSVPESVPDTLMLFGGADADLEDGHVVSESWFCSRNARWTVIAS